MSAEESKTTEGVPVNKVDDAVPIEETAAAEARRQKKEASEELTKRLQKLAVERQKVIIIIQLTMSHECPCSILFGHFLSNAYSG
jgi:hypothetical protein